MSSKATLDRYKSILDSLMSFLHQNDEKYGKEKVYSQEELNCILPDDVVCWMKLSSVGTPDPKLDADPKLARSNTLQFYKKAILFFIPNCLNSWNTTRMEGNRTKSLEVNAFIKMVEKKEVRKQGAVSLARRALTEKEFRVLHQVFKTQSPPSKHLELTWKFGMPAFLNYQFHLIARIDDTTQVTIDNICVHNKFSNCLKTKLNWSKMYKKREMRHGR
jgi:hypothetical protein